MSYGPHTFDDLAMGQAFVAGPRRVSREDIAAFAEVSGDHTALHTDPEYAATTPLGGLVAHGALSLAVATGLAHDTGAFETTVLAFRSLECSYDRPVFPDDELTLTLTVDELDARPKPDRGRVRFDVAVRNQHGKVVLSGHWRLVLRRETGSA